MGPFTGGCQCGAVRFAVDGDLGRAGICHCRMCQKAFGALYAPLVDAPGLRWTRGEPKYFQSSNVARRGFCADCGTPLTYESETGVELAIGALDDPEAARPTLQFAPDDRVSWLAELDELPVPTGAEGEKVAAFYAGVVSLQHPDHDTERWPEHQA